MSVTFRFTTFFVISSLFGFLTLFVVTNFLKFFTDRTASPPKGPEENTAETADVCLRLYASLHSHEFGGTFSVRIAKVAMSRTNILFLGQRNARKGESNTGRAPDISTSRSRLVLPFRCHYNELFRKMLL